MRAFIFNIQHFSLHDGPGARTVIFFKRCNLRCVWCHNPESIGGRQELLFYPERCIGCMECVRQCPQQALEITDKGIMRSEELCKKCFRCVQVCCNQARRYVGEEVEVDWLKDVIKENLPYYRQSGGVTFSGGECMLQLPVLEELLWYCKELHVHTAVDTAGNVPWESFERILPCTDLFLYDLKAMDDRVHRVCTGVGNERILDNYKKLLDAGAACIVRIPYVPGWNDKELPAIADFLQKYPPIDTELLGYHNLGQSKTEAMGKKEDRVFVSPSSQELNTLRNIYGFH